MCCTVHGLYITIRKVFVFEFGRRVAADDSDLEECGMSKLVISLDEKSEKEMVEKSEVSI